ncbi:MAG: dATP/dGTP diphosphohydrolase domain-containing protein, partial [bacterium]
CYTNRWFCRGVGNHICWTDRTFSTLRLERILMNGVKFDGAKLRWSLLPLRAVEDVVKVLEFGARKYAPDNWMKVPDARERYWDAAMRHMIEWKAGDKKDGET